MAPGTGRGLSGKPRETKKPLNGGAAFVGSETDRRERRTRESNPAAQVGPRFSEPIPLADIGV